MPQAPAIAPPGASEIRARWRAPFALAPDNPGDPDTEWRGPCPKCKARGAFTAAPGTRLPVVCCIHCDCDQDDVHVILKRHVPNAPRPGKKQNRGQTGPAKSRSETLKPPGDPDALQLVIRRLVLNPALRGQARDLALLEATGLATEMALDMLGITDTGNRRRARQSRAKALSPAATVKRDSKRRSKVPKPRPAETVKSDNPATINGVTLTCGNTGLTDRATLVLAPEGTGHHTDTTQALDLRPCLHCGEPLDPVLTQAGYVDHAEDAPAAGPDMDAAVALLTRMLGAEVIPDTWPPAEEGPCRRCGARTHLYGYEGDPWCAKCRAA